jgi:hypothetical protein
MGVGEANPYLPLGLNEYFAKSVTSRKRYWGKRQMNILLLVDTTIEGASPSHARQE